ncbi:MAG: hypothetical protein AB7R90_19165 [Reyranellaceae bacterium]
MTEADRSFAAGLIAKGPAREHREALMLYGQFVGNWTTATVEWLADGTVHESQWDVRFEWVLEGRAVQDLWITPVRSARPVPWSEPGNRYSTTLRIYDPVIDAWHIIWVNPPGGTILRQLGRKVGDEIVQLGDVEPDGTVNRWVYRDIGPQTFRWCREQSSDNGASWKLRQQMLARRV